MTLALRRFRVLETLAQGGMGELFLVDDLENGGRAVLKVSRNSDVIGAARFEHEVEILRALDHPLIPRWLDDGDWQGRRAVAVSHVEGLPLAQLMARLDRQFPPLAAVSVALDVLAALQHVHTLTTDDSAPRSLVHRDVSPHNILCAPNGHAHLIDFGIATDVAFGEEAPNIVTGTLAYMAPEQAHGQTINHSVDQFAVGVVLWELLSGVRLFGGDSVQQTWANVVRCVVPPLPALELPAAMSTSLSLVLLRMLAPRAKDRFSSCAAAATALAAAVGAEGSTTLATLVEQAKSLAAVDSSESTRPCRPTMNNVNIAV